MIPNPRANPTPSAGRREFDALLVRESRSEIRRQAPPRRVPDTVPAVRAIPDADWQETWGPRRRCLKGADLDDVVGLEVLEKLTRTQPSSRRLRRAGSSTSSAADRTALDVI